MANTISGLIRPGETRAACLTARSVLLRLPQPGTMEAVGRWLLSSDAMVAFRLSPSRAPSCNSVHIRRAVCPSVRVALASKHGALNASVVSLLPFGVPYLVRVRSVS